MSLLRYAAAPLLASLVVGCATTGTSSTFHVAESRATSIDVSSSGASPASADRNAILAMVGEYEVVFDFKETATLVAGYERKPAYHSAGYETVIVVEDAPGHIVLQHILVSKDGGHVTKHWRQDWNWEASTRFEFTDDQTWRLRPIPAASTAGAWTQCVYEVNDAPRYCGTGKWNHRNGIATWTSDDTWRPLPRREHTTRNDYNALSVENRQTIVPDGWTHEQDNTKVQRDASGQSRTLVREFGFNDYRRLAKGEVDFTPAYRYWEGSKDYWSRVRQEWSTRMASAGGVHLDTKIDGMPLIMATFQQADRVINGEAVTDDELHETFDKYVKPPGETLAGR